ncbi:alpha/beta family hydrolase [Ketobacter sp.]
MDDDYETISALIQPKIGLLLNYLRNHPEHTKTGLRLLFAHGAGAPMDSGFMNFFSEAISACGVEVIRFEFPYMQKRRQAGGKRPPDRMPVLLDCYREVIEHWGGAGQCVLAGKSMGGRVASMVLADRGAKAAVSIGYPFHPPGRPERLRAEHWSQIQSPWLILQGTRDPFGKPQEVAQYPLPQCAQLRWIDEGDHDFKPRKRSGLTQQTLWAQSAEMAANFVINLERK